MTVYGMTVYGRCLSSPDSRRARTVDRFALVRESTEGLFHSHDKGEIIDDRKAPETLQITRETSERLFDFAFRLARQRRAQGTGEGRVTCVDKANVFRAFAFFREIFHERTVHFPELRADAAYVDAAALRMVLDPWNFDVLVRRTCSAISSLTWARR